MAPSIAERSDASEATPSSDVVRVAIIGSGLTGLVATYLLSSPLVGSKRLCVELFERSSTLGMDSASVSVPLKFDPTANDIVAAQAGKVDKANKMLRIDVPMRAFTGGYYPELLSLYRHLKINISRSNFTYSFARATAEEEEEEEEEEKVPTPFLLYNGASGMKGVSLPSTVQPKDAHHLTATISSVKFHLSQMLAITLSYLQLLVIALYHHYTGHTRDPDHPIYSMTLQQLCRQPFPQDTRPKSLLRSLIALFLLPATILSSWLLLPWLTLDPAFVADTLVPLFSAVMTCSSSSVLQSPATELLDYVALTFGKDHFVVRDGVRQVVQSLLVNVDSETGKVWTSAEVHKISRRGSKIFLSVNHLPISEGSTPASTSSSEEGELREHGGYDHIIFATQANQSARFLTQYSSSLPSATNRVETILDKLKVFKYEKSHVINHTDVSLLPHAKADWRDLNLISGRWTMVTHLIGKSIMQTTNPLPRMMPKEEDVISESRFKRAVLDVPAKLARKGLFDGKKCGELQGSMGVWVCGSWADGIPLLEGCVMSARTVVQKLLQTEGLELLDGVPWDHA